MSKPNCYDCKHRGSVPGDAHSRCRHPEVGGGSSNIIEDMARTLVGDMNAAAVKLGIKGNPHGIRSGWFMWPANFDPVWLESCDGFAAKEAEKPA